MAFRSRMKWTLWPVASWFALSACAAPPAPQVVDLTGAFVTFFDETRVLPEAERVQAFRERVAPLHAAFYGIDRFGGRMTAEQRDRQIARALRRFPQIRDAFMTKAAGFRAELDRNVTRFLEAFPDFASKQPIYLLHSLGEMDGGTRELNGAVQLIFGADGMAEYHARDASESAFFLHELFHVYHRERFGDCKAVWCWLWVEGLAVHVAEALSPGATDAELLLDFPSGTAQATRASLSRSFIHLGTVLSSQDDDVIAALFSTGKDDIGLPSRRGYLLGQLVAREVARGMSLQQLAKMPQPQVQRAVENAVEELSRELPGAPSIDPRAPENSAAARDR